MSTRPSAIYRGVDMTGFGTAIRVNVVSVGVNRDVTPPDTVFRDLRSALNGRGSRELLCLAFQIVDSWTGAGAVTTGFDADGHFYIESDTESFSMSEGSGGVLTALGFDGDVPVIAGGAPFRATAARPPVPGPFSGGSGLVIDPTAAASYKVGLGRWYATPITALRNRGSEGDADDIAGSLEETIQGTHADLADMSVGIDIEGRTVIAWPSTAPRSLTWLDTTFRDLLGFTGAEAQVDDGDVVTLTAARVNEAVGVLPYGIERMEPINDRLGDQHDGRDGHHVVAKRGRFKGVVIDFTVEGPDSGSDDTHRHFIDRVLPYVGEPLTLEPIFGEPRRRMDPYHATSTRAGHSLLETTRPICGTTNDGYGGRIPGELLADNRSRLQIVWESDSGLRAGGRLQLILREVG